MSEKIVFIPKRQVEYEECQISVQEARIIFGEQDVVLVSVVIDKQGSKEIEEIQFLLSDFGGSISEDAILHKLAYQTKDAEVSTLSDIKEKKEKKEEDQSIPRG